MRGILSVCFVVCGAAKDGKISVGLTENFVHRVSGSVGEDGKVLTNANGNEFVQRYSGRVGPHGVLMSDEDEPANDEVIDMGKRAWLEDWISRNQPKTLADSNDANTDGAEVDSRGNIIIDYFCGFTKAAAEYVNQNLLMSCEVGAEAVTSALADSGIGNVRVRVVGAAAFNESEDLDTKWSLITSADLKESVNLVKPLGAKEGADIMTTFLLRDPEQGGTVIGRSYVPGEYSLITIDEIGNAEHDMGHNFGLRHCPDPELYPKGNTGYHVPELGYGTLMCGDVIPLWSSPKLKFQGYALGDSATSSVRFLQSALGASSVNAVAVHPLDKNFHFKRVIKMGVITLAGKSDMSEPFTFTVTDGMDTVWLTSNLGKVSYMYVQKGKAPTSTDYLAMSTTTLIQLNDPEPGTYYVTMLTRRAGAEGVTRRVNVSTPLRDPSSTTTVRPSTTKTTTRAPTTTTKTTTRAPTTTTKTTTRAPTTTTKTTTRAPTTTTKTTTRAPTTTTKTTTRAPTTTTKTTTRAPTTTTKTTTHAPTTKTTTHAPTSVTTRAPTTTSTSAPTTKITTTHIKTTTNSDDIPAWDKNTIYEEPCTKVRHKGYVFVNDWYIFGVEPNPDDDFGPWRRIDSPYVFPDCV